MAKSYESQQTSTSRSFSEAEAKYTAVTPGSSNLAPSPTFPEKFKPVFEVKTGNNTQRRGPLRFEEGLGTDTDLPDEFMHGIRQGYETAPGRPNHNLNVFEKYPDETMRERYHVGSASWVEGPDYLGQFAGGASQEAERKFIQVTRPGSNQRRRNAAVIQD
jgi:hypothetical protein